jgi:hypothetical protein
MSDEAGPTAKTLYRGYYRPTCHKRDRFLSNPDNSHLSPSELVSGLVELVAAELGAKPDPRDEVRRGVEDAMAGHLIPEDRNHQEESDRPHRTGRLPLVAWRQHVN